MEREDMNKMIAASEWKGYWESLINENTALRAELAALKEAARALLADLDTHATGSMGDTQDKLTALVGEG